VGWWGGFCRESTCLAWQLSGEAITVSQPSERGGEADTLWVGRPLLWGWVVDMWGGAGDRQLSLSNKSHQNLGALFPASPGSSHKLHPNLKDSILSQPMPSLLQQTLSQAKGSTLIAIQLIA
jgi:hypothetical protein